MFWFFWYIAAGVSTIALEYLILQLHVRKLRRSVAFLVVGVHIMSLIVLFYQIKHPLVLLAGLGGIYRIINTLRIVVDRQHIDHQKRVALKSSIGIVALQCIFLAAHWYLIPVQVSPRIVYSLTLWASVPTAILMLMSTIISFILAQPKRLLRHMADRDLPTVSVLIPARNETRDLESCIRSVLASDYPKLEIIVLDDCSTDNTSEVIKTLAQDGVRFVSSATVDDTWLPKNRAYQTLLENASGEYVLFCGVDVRFTPGSIKRLVLQLLEYKLIMLSLLPQRYSFDLRHVIFQPMRYFWELSLPRFLSNRPPVLSTAWLVNRKALLRAGGFATARRMVTPEAHFARIFSLRQAYAFIFSSPENGMHSVKGFQEQRNTAIRTKYPQMHRKPEMVYATTVLYTVLAFLPISSILFGLALGEPTIFVPAVVASCILTVNYVILTSISSPANSIISLLTLPAAVIVDLIVLHISMWNYEFGKVEWKDRNICIPVMHVVPTLPKFN